MGNEKRIKLKGEIINATIECISEYGINGATVRQIASKADVNPSAISYYFGNREELVRQALHVTLDNAFDLSDIDIVDDDSYQEVLKKVLIDWEQGATAYPGICRAHFDEILNCHIGSSIVSDRINSFIEKVFHLLVNHGLNNTDNNSAKLKAIFGSFVSSLIMPSVAKPKMEGDGFINLLVSMI